MFARLCTLPAFHPELDAAPHPPRVRGCPKGGSGDECQSCLSAGLWELSFPICTERWWNDEVLICAGLGPLREGEAAWLPSPAPAASGVCPCLPLLYMRS